MGFRVFLLVSGLIVPLITIICGYFMLKRPPKEINDTVGYRTPMSKKNKETWFFAHRCCGKLWLKTGTVILVLSLLAFIPYVSSGSDAFSAVIGIAVGIQTVALVLTIIPVERALKRNFDENGNKRESRPGGKV